jgi:hypothetical protein
VLVERLCKKLPTAIDAAKEAQDAFHLITNTADQVKVAEWELQAKEAQANRHLHPEAMDIYDMKSTAGLLLYILSITVRYNKY